MLTVSQALLWTLVIEQWTKWSPRTSELRKEHENVDKNKGWLQASETLRTSTSQIQECWCVRRDTMPLPSQFFFSHARIIRIAYGLASSFPVFMILVICASLAWICLSSWALKSGLHKFSSSLPKERQRFKLPGYSGVKALTVACSKVASHSGPQSSLRSPTGTKQKRWEWRQGNTHMNILLQANNRWKQSFKRYCSNIPKQNAYVWVISAHPGTLWAS